MNKQFNELLEECNSSKAKIYYQLNDLIGITGLSIRMLKYKMLKIKKKYKNVPSLLFRDGRPWKIHHSIVNEFMPKKKRKAPTVYNYKWQSIITWNPVNRYDADYHLELLNNIKQLLPTYHFLYSVEKDMRGVNHVHSLTDASKEALYLVVGGVLKRYWDINEFRLQIADLNNKFSAVQYLTKSPVSQGII